ARVRRLQVGVGEEPFLAAVAVRPDVQLHAEGKPVRAARVLLAACLDLEAQPERHVLDVEPERELQDVSSLSMGAARAEGRPGPVLRLAPRPAAPLLERDRALARLDALLDAVRADGRGRLVLVAGEAGVGKTLLLRRFCDEQDVRVLRGACDPLFTPR